MTSNPQSFAYRAAGTIKQLKREMTEDKTGEVNWTDLINRMQELLPELQTEESSNHLSSDADDSDPTEESEFGSEDDEDEFCEAEEN